MQEDYLNRLENLAKPSPLNRINLNSQSILKWTVEDETELFKQTLLIPWMPENLLDYYELDINYQQTEPSAIDFFAKRGFIEPYSMIRNEPRNLKEIIAFKSQIKVYCDDKQIVNYLTDQRFVFVNDRALADIWWYSSYFFEFAKMYSDHPTILINQFPLGHLIDDKTAMFQMCIRKLNNCNGNFNERTLDPHPIWLPATFELTNELNKFVAYFVQREKRKLNNYWILKPPNLTKSKDVFITNNLNAIIRIRSSSTRIASKYISNPLLFYRLDIKSLVKFEINYFVVLTSVLPLKFFVYKAFQVNFANKPYDLAKHLYNQGKMNLFK